MGVPARFAIEYAGRCLELMASLQNFAQQKDLVGSFSLLVAGAVLTMPYERMKPSHFLHAAAEDGDLSDALTQLKKTDFLAAPFWRDKPADGWKQSRIVGEVSIAGMWKDAAGLHPFDEGAENSIGRRKTDDVVRVLRNALSHGNVVYLNKDGRDVPGDQMRFLGFLSEYEHENAEHGAVPNYRMVAVPETEFFRFVNDWTHWISRLEHS